MREVEVIGWQELVRRSGSVGKARTALRSGAWWRVLRDAYACGAEEDDLDTRLAALRRVLPPDVVLSHRAALWVLGRDVLKATIDVTAGPNEAVLARPGMTPHEAALPDEELVEVGGLLIVSAARACLDVARKEPLIEAVAFGDEVLRSGAATEDQVLASLERAAGLRGVIAARVAVPHLNGRSESPMESRMRMAFVLGGVSGLEVQRDVYDADGHAGRADLAVEDVLCEYDGYEGRQDKAVHRDERRRQNRLSDTAHEVRRFTAADVYGTPARMIATVKRAAALMRGRDLSGSWRGRDTLRPPALTPLATRAHRKNAA